MSHLQSTRQQLGRWAALAALSTSVIFAAPSALAITGKFVPANGILMTIGQDVDSINGYTSAMGTAPAGVTNYVGIANLDGLNSNGDAGAGRNNISELANTYPTSALVIGVSMNGQVDAVAAGSYNANIDTLLHKLASYNRPVFLRWAYEVDGPWNGHSPNGVIQSFRYVHGRIATLGYSNRIAMVWQTMSYCPIDSNIAQWYPGDQYVDWIGLSYFAPQDCNAREVRKTADFAVAHNKPLMINESTPQRFAIGELTYSADAARGSGRVNKTASQIWNEWFVGYFEFMDTYSANIKAVTYINANWNAQSRWASGNEGYWGDSRVQANATIKINWSAELNSGALTGETFIHQASANLFSQLGFGGGTTSSVAPSSKSASSSAAKSSIAIQSSVAIQSSTAASTPVSNGVFGLTTSGVIYHLDGGQTASFVYLCVNGDCRTPTKNGNRYERVFGTVDAATTYALEFKVQDNATGQCIATANIKPGTGTTSGCFTGPIPSSSSASSISSKAPTSSAKSSTTALTSSSKSSVVVIPSSKSSSSVAPSSIPKSSSSVTPSSISKSSSSIAPISSSSGSSSSQPVAGGDFGLMYVNATSGIIRHRNKPFTATFANLCFNGACASATLKNGYWERNVDGLVLGTTYNIGTQIQDNATGQCAINANIIFQASSAYVSSSCLPPDTQSPSIPANLQGIQRNGRAISLTWDAATDNRGVTYYEIFRNGTRVAAPVVNNYNDAGLTESSNYKYAVNACDAAQNCSAKTAEISVLTGTFVPDTTPPTVPSGLTGEGKTQQQVLLKWNAATDAAGVIASYDIYKDGTKINSSLTTQYTVAGLSAGETHAYSVRACDDSANCSARTANVNVASKAPSFDHLDWSFNSHNSTAPQDRGGQPMRPHNEGSVGPAAYTSGPEFLATPINGIAPTMWGFAFDINGGTVNWRFGGGFNDGYFTGYSNVEMYCSADNNLSFDKVVISAGGIPGGASVSAQIPIRCVTAGTYTYFFRYKHPMPLNNDPASAWIYTAGFTTAGARIDPRNYPSFTDGSANWMRYRHPVSHDGTTAAVTDNKQNSDTIRMMDRYTIWVDDKPGNVKIGFDITNPCNCLVRNDTLRNSAGNTNGQQQFFFQQSPGFDNAFSYGQVVQFEFTASGAGASGSQTYNDFSYYTIGKGFGAYGDPRLNSAGKAGSTMWFSDSGAYSKEEYNAVFTQPLTTLNSEQMIDDFIVGHHLFHGVDPHKKGSHVFDDPDVQIGERTCGNCHFRDGRGSEVINTPRGKRLPPPTYGVKLLEMIDGRQAGFRWDGQMPSVAAQVKGALAEDHKVNPDHLPVEIVNLITTYTEVVTVPNRNPGAYDQPGVAQGEMTFTNVGCVSCHTPVQKTRANAPAHLRNLTIRPYTDMKIWNLGEGAFRTAPLWGLGHNLDLLRRNGRAALFMHDGASTSIEDAISRHGGAAQNVITTFNALSATEKANVVRFVKTL